MLIDGGIRDGLGLVGLGTFSSEKKRVVNLVVGDFGFQGPGGIHSLPKGVNASSLVSIAIIGTPMCGPWAMGNGKRAVESARKAMLMALDTCLWLWKRELMLIITYFAWMHPII